jgi:putative addiction module antidote
MSTKLEIVDVGGSLGIVLPEDVLKHLKVEVGDTLWLSGVADGVGISRLNSEDSEAIDAGRRTMSRHSEVLKKLADR